MAPMMAASPITWTPGTSRLSKLLGSTGHQPVRSATPAAAAMRPARCGGMTLATAAWCAPKSVCTVLLAASTPVTLPPSDSDTHSSSPGYSCAQAAWNSRCLLNTSLASSTSSFDFGLCVFKCHAIRLARSYGPGGQRYGLAGTAMTTRPPSGIACNWSRNSKVCGPAFQACGMRAAAASV